MSVLAFRISRFIRSLTIVLAAMLARPAVALGNDVIPPIPPPPRPPIIGFADTHLHQFANLGFGGLEVWGSPVDPTLDASSPLSEARSRALPNSDFVYVSAAAAADYLYIAGVPAAATPLVEYCDNGACWPQCPQGTGVSGNACAKITIHGSGGSADLLNQLVPHGSPSHGVVGYPDMNGWPAFDVLTTQQAYWEWLGRAHQHGLKLMVMLAVNNSVLCQLAMHLNSFGCGDDGAVARQIQGAKNLETYIDARAGGPGMGFYRIVYSAEEARSAIQAGKLAVVLGTEVDATWGCSVGSATCTDSFIRDRVQDYYNDGIRVVYPVHLIDNKFGGAAVYTGLFEVENYLINGSFFDMAACSSPIEWRSDVRQVISDAQVAVAAAIAAIAVIGPAALPIIDAASAILMTTVPMISMMVPLIGLVLPGLAPILSLGGSLALAVAAIFITTLPGAVGSSTDGNCNARTLTAEGATLIDALMDHKMIIDIDHTDTPTFNAIMAAAEARHYPGIVSGHTGLIGSYLTRSEITDAGATFNASDSGRHEGNKTDAQVQRIIAAGGFVSLGLTGGGRGQLRDYSSSDSVAFNCGRSSEAFAQTYLYATKGLGLSAVGFGSDINGFAGMPAPRYGSKACAGDIGGYDPSTLAGRLNYATATDYFGAPITQHQFGNRVWDYNVDGFAHAGLYPDFVADLRAINLSNADLAPLFNGAEAYVRMWEKVDDDEAPTVRCGTVGEGWHDADVTVPCLSFDFGWGLADAADANFSLSTSVPDGTETGDASTGTHATICDNDSQCTGTIPAITGINVDKKDPSVVVTTPAAGTPSYILNQAVPADYACSDGGSGVATCAGPVADAALLDTATIGAHAFTVTGADNVGHTVQVPRPYNVTFAICAEYDQTKAHRAGSTVPIKLFLCDAAGLNVSSSSLVLTATAVTQISTSAPGVLEDAGNANPDNAFRYVNGSYIFNLKTTGLSTGTYSVTFTASGDPVPHQVLFQIR
jgi:microsomal dipeptidase-like Zn-dependent dipeptidase